MTIEAFHDYLHTIGCSVTRFHEMLEMWRQTPAGGEDMRVLGNEFNIDTATLEATVTTRNPGGVNTKTYQNPILAWNVFIGATDMAGRRRIEAQLEKKGFDPYTGELRRPPVPSSTNQTQKRPGAHCANCQFGEHGQDTCPARLTMRKCLSGIPLDPSKEVDSYE